MYADVGIPPSPGGVISTGDKTDKISMESERVVFDIEHNDENSPFFNEEYTSTIQKESHYAHVTADFVMKNVTASDVKMVLLFPVPGYAGYGDDWKEHFDPKSTLNPSINHQVKVNGASVNISYDAYEIEDIMSDANQEFYYPMNALVIEFPVTFKANAQTTISVEYDVEWYLYVKTIYGYFNYLLETGSHWKGSIGYGEIIFQFPDEIIPSMFDNYNDEFTLEDDRLVWTFTNLEPNRDHNIIVQYSPYLYTIWNNRDTAFKNISTSRSDQFIVPSDMPGEYFDNLMWWNFEGNPIYLLNRNSDAQLEYSRTQIGWWVAKFNTKTKPWIQYEFDNAYSLDTMVINSGILDSDENKSYDLVGRPKNIQVTFSNGSSKSFTLEDKAAEEITVSLGNVKTSSVKISILEVYPDYQGKSDWVGIDYIEFRPVGVLKKIELYPEQEEEPETDNITLPNSFLLMDSSTTRLDQMSEKQLEAVKNLTFEVVGKNKAVFSGTINLTGTETLTKLKKLSEYLDFDTIGKVTINTDQLHVFQNAATITMYSLSFTETPDIYKDGELATNKEVSNTSYNVDSGTLTFDVSTFSIYEAKEKAEGQIGSGQTADGSDSTAVISTGLSEWICLMIFCIVLIVPVVIAAIVIFIVVKKRAKKKKGKIDTKGGTKVEKRDTEVKTDSEKNNKPKIEESKEKDKKEAV